MRGKGHLSDPSTKVLQGSMLSPTLFTKYINNATISMNICHVHTHLYADDTIIYCSVSPTVTQSGRPDLSTEPSAPSTKLSTHPASHSPVSTDAKLVACNRGTPAKKLKAASSLRLNPHSDTPPPPPENCQYKWHAAQMYYLCPTPTPKSIKLSVQIAHGSDVSLSLLPTPTPTLKLSV